MENKLMNVLNDFAFNLQSISPRPIENMTIVLPWDNYKQLQWELENRVAMYIMAESPITVNTVTGIKFNISCKEVDEQQIQSKLQQCFKILSI